MMLGYGIEAPPRQARVINASDDPVDAGPSSYTIVKPPEFGGPLQVRMPESATSEGGTAEGFEGFPGQQSSTGSVGAPGGSSPSPQQSPQKATAASTALAQLMSSGSLDKSVGIDFVLA